MKVYVLWRIYCLANIVHSVFIYLQVHLCMKNINGILVRILSVLLRIIVHCIMCMDIYKATIYRMNRLWFCLYIDVRVSIVRRLYNVKKIIYIYNILYIVYTLLLFYTQEM